MGSTGIDRIARWILEFDRERIPSNVIDLAKLSLLDAVGGAIAARRYSQSATDSLNSVLKLSGPGGYSVIGQPNQIPVLEAALSNGLLIRALDTNDYLGIDPNDGQGLTSHPSDLMAVGLAAAEFSGASGRELLEAMVVGYEVNGRFQRVRGSTSPWDTSTASGLASPAIVGTLLKLDLNQLSSALSFGMAHGLTPGSVRAGGTISAAKFLADPIVATTGMLGCFLAADGVAGPVSVLEGPRGVGAALPLDQSQLDYLVHQFDGSDHYMFEGVCIKAYPCFGNAQAAVAAAVGARTEMCGDIESINRVEVRIADTPALTGQLPSHTSRSPDNQETADHSYPFVVATGVVDGELTLETYQRRRWTDPVLVGLMQRVEVIPDRSWLQREHGGSPASVTVIGTDGARSHAEVPYAPGHAMNPLGWSGVGAKFHSNVDGIIDSAQADAVVEAVGTLEKATSLHPLLALLRSRS